MASLTYKMKIHDGIAKKLKSDPLKSQIKLHIYISLKAQAIQICDLQDSGTKVYFS